MPHDPDTTFGRLLRELRLRAGFSQEQLAERAGMSTTGVGVLERELRHAPHRATVDLLADALGLSQPERAALEATAARKRGRAGAAEPPAPVLPMPPSSLVGRDADVTQILALLDDARLVTVTGSGGIGKTRVALAVAQQRAQRAEPIGFVDFDALTDGGFVSPRIASSVHPPLDGKPDSIATLAEALSTRSMLLVLDTCEHVVDDVAAAVQTILQRCPQVRVLATSRERLNVASEMLYRLPSLPLDAATDLFRGRAREAGAGIAFTPADDDLIRDVCRRLEGIPLAIELAAARMSTFGIVTLHARLDEHMALTAGRRDLPQRQQTMLATISWSYALLGEAERTFLRLLAVFSGGFTFDAAEQIAAEAGLGESVLGLLSSLVDKSLVDAMRGPDFVRYRLLDSVRAFAVAELRREGEDAVAHRRHAGWVAGLASRFETDVVRMTYVELRALEPELDNVRAAIAWALDGPEPGDRALAARIIFGMRGLWHMSGHIAEQRHWIDIGLERIDERDHPREVGQLLHAFVLRSWNEAGVIPVAERAIGLFERVGDQTSIAALHSTLSFIYATLGRLAEADAAAERAATLMIDRGLRGSPGYAILLGNRAALRTEVGRLDDARADISEATAIAGANGDRYFIVSRLLPRLMAVEFAHNNERGAIDLAEEMLASEFGDSNEVRIMALEALVFLRLFLGDVEAAAAAGRELLDGIPIDAAPWCHLAAIAALRGETHAAARLSGFIDNIYAQSEVPHRALERRSLEMLHTTVRERLARHTVDALRAEGARLTPAEAGALALRGLAETDPGALPREL
jgi:predicted ATPase/transcriptional regulator with XRE-family HTH domain